MSKEYIEREALIEELKRRDFLPVIVKQAIEAVPAADVAPVRHGRWEDWWPGIGLIMTGEEMLYRCSVCDAKYSTVESYKYCPNCGAKMDGEEKR